MAGRQSQVAVFLSKSDDPFPRAPARNSSILRCQQALYSVMLDYGLESIDHTAVQMFLNARRERIEIVSRDLEIVVIRIGRIAGCPPSAPMAQI